MQAKLSSIGDELAIILDRATLDALGIDRETTLEVTSDARGVWIRPVGDDHRSRVLASARKMMDAHDETFRKLAL